jgi:hypothetical protein
MYFNFCNLHLLEVSISISISVHNLWITLNTTVWPVGLKGWEKQQTEIFALLDITQLIFVGSSVTSQKSKALLYIVVEAWNQLQV